MLKRVLSLVMLLLVALVVTGCENTPPEDEDTGATDDITNVEEEPNVADKPFSESNGLIQYFTINGENIAIPETIGEYAKYLEKIGTKVELVSNPNKADVVTNLDETLEEGNQSSLKAYFKVYVDDTNYHKFGVYYYNDTDREITVSQAKIGRMILFYDSYYESTVEEQPELSQIDSIILIMAGQEFPMNGTTNSKDLLEVIGNPEQNTDGYWTYRHESGYVYKFATSNQRGQLTQVEISYPEQ